MKAIIRTKRTRNIAPGLLLDGVYRSCRREIWSPLFEGIWNKGKLTGHATVRYASGDRYTGSFENGLRSGMGVMFSVKTG